MAESVADGNTTEFITVIVKWGGKEYPIDILSSENTVGHLKLAIETQTGVLAKRQKLLGLKHKGHNNCLFEDYEINLIYHNFGRLFVTVIKIF